MVRPRPAPLAEAAPAPAKRAAAEKPEGIDRFVGTGQS